VEGYGQQAELPAMETVSLLPRGILLQIRETFGKVERQ
jgi:hypothetical protein